MSESLTAAPTWSERIANAVAAWMYWHDLPSGARMDRAFKESGVRDLVVERDRYRETLIKLSGWNNWDGQDVRTSRGRLSMPDHGPRTTPLDLHSVHADIVEQAMAAGHAPVAAEQIAQAATPVEATIAVLERREAPVGVRITDPTNVALYDSVSGFAFGPIFPSDLEAQEFLDWLPQGDDPRDMRDDKIDGLYRQWQEERQ